MDNLEELAAHLGHLLLEQDLLIATAESCTGGLLAEIITRIPGSSQWFERGFISYSNLAKHEMLEVSHETLVQHGAVSEATARAMALGCLENSEADVSVAITGIAGPDGGTQDKPVGTVCLAWHVKQQETVVKRVFFKGNRLDIRTQSCELALKELIILLTQ